jgi:uncharacterized membrane protein YhaH (DUF805 family)
MQHQMTQRSAMPTIAGVLAIASACISVGFQVFFISRVPTQFWTLPLVLNSLVIPLVINIALLGTGLAVLLRLSTWRALAGMLGILLLIGALAHTILFGLNIARSGSLQTLLSNWSAPLLVLRWLTGLFLVIAGSSEALQVGERPTGGALSHFFSFRGRSLRCDYWTVQLFHLVFLAMAHSAAWAMAAIASAPGASGRADLFSSPVYIGVMVVFGLATIVSSLAVHVRRWHDQDKSGAWQLLTLLPFGSFVVLVFCGFIRGTQGPNHYGADPSWRIAPPQPYGNPYPPQPAYPPPQYPPPHYQQPPYHGR